MDDYPISNRPVLTGNWFQLSLSPLEMSCQSFWFTKRGNCVDATSENVFGSERSMFKTDWNVDGASSSTRISRYFKNKQDQNYPTIFFAIGKFVDATSP